MAASGEPLALGLTPAELEHFHSFGWVRKAGVIAPEHIAALASAVSEQLGPELDRLVEKGALAPEHTFGDAPFETRIGLAVHALPDPADKARLINRFMGRRGADPITPHTLPIIKHEPFRACLESILGPIVVAGSDAPLRAKVPLDPVLAAQHDGQCRTPWHQDAIFRTNTDCDNFMSVQCWIPLVDATLENGCLHFLPYRFDEGLMPHYVGGGFLGIHPDDMPKDRAPVPVEASAGDVVLWSNMTPHASFHNDGSNVRWSMDWRFYGADKPNNISLTDELPTGATECHKPLLERTALACSFPSADFVLLDRGNPEREVATGDGIIAARESFEEHRMGSEVYKELMELGGRPARWRDVREHPGHDAEADGHSWAVQEDPRDWEQRPQIGGERPKL